MGSDGVPMRGGGFAFHYCRALTRHYGKVFVLCIAIVIALSAVSVAQYKFMVEMTEPTSYDWTVSESEQSEQRDAIEWARDHRDTRRMLRERRQQRRRRRRLDDHRDDDDEDEPRSNERDQLAIVYQHKGLGSNESVITPASLKAMCEVENVLLSHRDYPRMCYDGESFLGHTHDKRHGENTRCAKQAMSIVSLFYLAWSPWYPTYSPSHANYSFRGRDETELGMLQLYGGVPAVDMVDDGAPTDEAALFDGHQRVCDELDAGYVANRTAQIIELLDHSDDLRSLLGFFLSKDVEKTGRTQITRSALVVSGRPLDGYDDIDDREDEQRGKYRAYHRSAEQAYWRFFGMVDQPSRSAYRSSEPATESGDYPSAAQRGPLDVRYVGPWSDFEFTRMVDNDFLYVVGSVGFVLIYISLHTFSLFLGCLSMLQIFSSLPLAFFFYRAVGGISYFTQLHILTVFLVLGVGADDVFVYVDAWKQARLRPELDTQFKRVHSTWTHTAQGVFNTSLTTASAFFATALNPVMPISSFGIYAAVAIIINYVLTITLFPTIVLIWENELSSCWAWARGRTVTRVPMGVDGAERADAEAVLPLPVADTPRSTSAAGRGGDDELAARSRAAPAADGAADASKLRLIERLFQQYYAPALNWAPLARAPWLKPLSLALVLAFATLGGVGSYYASQLQPPTEQEQWFTPDHMYTGFGDLSSERFLSGAEDDYIEMTVVLGISGVSRPDFSRWFPDQNRGEAVFDDTFDLRDADAHSALLRLCDGLRDAPCAVDACVGGFGRLVRPNTLECPLEDFDAWYNETKFNATRHGEYDGGEHRPTGDEFLELLQEFSQESGYETASSIGFIDGTLKYVEVPFTATLLSGQPFSTTFQYMDAIRDALRGVLAGRRGAAKLGEKPYVYAGRHFTWVVTERALVDGVLQGFTICFPVAFCVLVVATGSPMLSVYAIVAIAMIVGTTLGFCQAVMGWGLGVAESISSTIVIGFSVDFVVHLGHAYRESAQPSRSEKTSDALTQMGITVLAGAITTGGSGLFMFPAQMTFFTKASCCALGSRPPPRLRACAPRTAQARPAPGAQLTTPRPVQPACAARRWRS